MLFDGCGGRRFLQRWFAVTPLLGEQRPPAGKGDYVTARDNFVLAACVGAGRDISGLFASRWRWPISAGIVEPGGVLDSLLGAVP